MRRRWYLDLFLLITFGLASFLNSGCVKDTRSAFSLGKSLGESMCLNSWYYFACKFEDGGHSTMPCQASNVNLIRSGAA